MNQSGTHDSSLQFLTHFRFRRGWTFGIIIVAALLAFELFNYSTTDYALRDLLGDLRFLGVRWATILSIAFCGIDFAGIARLFTPEDGAHETTEVWYLFGAWLLAATMNAMLTWWGVSLAVLGHETLGNAVIERTTLLRVVPIFVAVLVWLIRVLIIGTFSVAGDRLFSQGDSPVVVSSRSYVPQPQAPAPAPVRSLGTRNAPSAARAAAVSSSTFRPAPKPNNAQPEAGYGRNEPTYHPASASMSGPSNPNQASFSGNQSSSNPRYNQRAGSNGRH